MGVRVPLPAPRLASAGPSLARGQLEAQVDIIYNFLLVLYLLVAVGLVYFVLSQEPKQTGGDLLGGSSDLFQARGVTGGLYRITVILGIAFVVLAWLLGRLPR